MNWKGAIIGLVATLVLRYALEWFGVDNWFNGWLCCLAFTAIYKEIN